MQYYQLAILVLLFALASPLALAQQFCYATTARSSDSTQCQALPFYALVDFSLDTDCSYFYCSSNTTYNGVTGDQLTLRTTNFNYVPKPSKYVELIYYNSSQCTGAPNRIEFFADSSCTAETGFYAICNKTHVQVIRYEGGCDGSVLSEQIYPRNTCTEGSDEAITTSCGTYQSTPANAPIGYTPYAQPPVTLRATPLICYYNPSLTSITTYEVTDANYICTKYAYICPPNVAHCTEGSTVTIYTFVSKETCQQILQIPEYYLNATCCDTNYCNGPDQKSPVSVSGTATIAPPLFSMLFVLIAHFYLILTNNKS